MSYAGYPEEVRTVRHLLLAGICLTEERFVVHIGKGAWGEPIRVHRRMYGHWVPHSHFLFRVLSCEYAQETVLPFPV